MIAVLLLLMSFVTPPTLISPYSQILNAMALNRLKNILVLHAVIHNNPDSSSGTAVALVVRSRIERWTNIPKEDNVPVSGINDGAGPQIILASRNKSRTREFSDILHNTASENERNPIRSSDTGAPAAGRAKQVPYIELGRISEEAPTVSHILKNHPEFSAHCWDIIFSSINRGKDFTNMKDGTLIALKPGSSELIWGERLDALVNRTNAALATDETDRSMTKPGDARSVVIGTISKKHPTVSHLFEANPNFDRGFWEIIHSPLNRNKKYTSLTPGTQVVLDTKTMELSFHKNSPAGADTQTAKMNATEQDLGNAKIGQRTLADAVKPFIGTPYEQIDCYGLIVRGLQNQGIQYRGHGGIREKLEALAVRNGLPGNAYFNGEGLVEKAGTKVYSKSLDHVSGSRKKADEIYDEMMPFLREGFILSFSTPTQGHTGIVAKQGDEWTYINSGVIDNEVSSLNLSKGVGEESLKAELKNWLALAAKKQEPLTVTLGHVENKHS